MRVRSLLKRIFYLLLGGLGVRPLRGHSFFGALLATPAVVADFGAHRGEFFAALKSEYSVSRALLVEADPALAESLKGTFGNKAEVNLSHSARTALVQDSYSSPSLLRVFNDLFVAVLLFDFVPESRDLAAAVSRMLDNVMEGDNPAWPDKR